MAAPKKTSSVNAKSVTLQTSNVVIGPPDVLILAAGPAVLGAFMPIDFQARQDAIGLKRRTGGDLAAKGSKSISKAKPSDVSPTEAK
jgi:hypothetical protein